jgi:hypothetical protein
MKQCPGEFHFKELISLKYIKISTSERELNALQKNVKKSSKNSGIKSSLSMSIK